MAADLVLSVDLDPKDAIQTAKDLKKEVNKVMEAGKNEAKAPVNTASMERAKIKVQDLTAKIEDASNKQSELIKQMEAIQNIETPSKVYADLETELGTVTQQLDQVQKKMQFDEQAGGALYLNSEELQKDAQLYEDLEDRMYAIHAEMDRMEQQGTHLIDPKTTEEYQKLNEKLEAANNKMKVLTLQYQEASKKASGVSNSVQKLTEDTGKAQKAAQMMAGTGNIAGAVGFNGVAKALSTVLKTLKRVAVGIVAITLGVRGIMGIVNKIRSAIREGFQYLMQGDKDLKKRVDKLKDSFAEVKANLAAAFMPIIDMAIPYIQKLIDWLNVLISKIAMFVAAIAGQSAYTKAIKKTGDAAASASKQLSKFDELNNLTTSGGSDWSTEKVPIDSKMLETVEKLKAILAEIKKLFDELIAEPFMEGFLGSIGDWQSKIEKIKENIKSIGTTLWEIFTDPQVVAAQAEYIKSFSKFLGSLVGLAANIGLNIAEAITGGIAQFLDEHKEEIKTDLTSLYELGSGTFDNFTQLATDISEIVNVIGESTSLQDTLSNLLGVVYELYSALGLVAAQLADLVSGTVADIVHDHVEQIKESLEGLFEVMSKVTGFLEQVATTIKGLLLRLVDEVITPIVEALKPLISNVIDVVLDLWNKLQPVLLWFMDHVSELWADYVDPILNQIMDLAAAVAELVGEVVGRIWDVYLKPLVDLIMAWMPTILSVVKVTFDGIFFLIKVAMTLIGSLLSAITDTVKMVTKLIQGDWRGAWEAATQIINDLFAKPFEKIWGAFVEYFEECYNHYMELFVNLMHGVVKTAETIANAILSLINDSILAIYNKVAAQFNKIPGVSLPTDISIPEQHWSAAIPALAQGAVIPPSMSDFIARLGDNNTETEVVSPLSTMKEALLEALQEAGGSGEYHIHVDVDGREIAKAVVRQNEIYKKSTGGRTMFA